MAHDIETKPVQAYGLNVKSIRPDTREADFVASTAAIDSHGEIVEQVWDLERYTKNPIVLYGHDRWDLPIGKSTKVGLVNGQLECTIQFASKEMNEKAEQVWLQVQGGFLRAVSVGFRPNEVRLEVRDGEDVWVLSKNELLEISVVPIPSNPEALAKMKAKARDALQATTVATGDTEKSMEVTEQAAKAEQEEAAAVAVVETVTPAAEQATEQPAEKQAPEAAHTTAVESTDDVASKAVAERDAALKAAQEARAELDAIRAKAIAKEVDDLVGKKFMPAAKDAFLALANLSKKHFDAIVEHLPPLKVLDQVIPQTNDKAVGAADLGELLLKEQDEDAPAQGDLGSLL